LETTMSALLIRSLWILTATLIILAGQRLGAEPTDSISVGGTDSTVTQTLDALPYGAPKYATGAVRWNLQHRPTAAADPAPSPPAAPAAGPGNPNSSATTQLSTS
jgi:hypothetical protein